MCSRVCSCSTCSAAGAMEERWRRHCAHLVSTLTKTGTHFTFSVMESTVQLCTSQLCLLEDEGALLTAHRCRRPEWELLFSGDAPLGGDRYQTLITTETNTFHTLKLPSICNWSRISKKDWMEKSIKETKLLSQCVSLLFLSCVIGGLTYAELLPVCGAVATRLPVLLDDFRKLQN